MAIGTDFKPSTSNSFYSNFPAYSPKRRKFLGSAGSSFTDGFTIDSSKNISTVKYDTATTAYESYHLEPEGKSYKVTRLGTRKLKRLQNGLERDLKKLGKLGCPIIQLYEPKARSVAYDLLDSINFSIDDIPSAPTNEKHPVRIVDRQVIRYFRGQKSLLPDLIQLDSAIQSFMARKEAKLIIEQESSLLRFAMHSICRFYNLHSSSCNQVVTILAKKCNDIENSMTFIDMIQNT